MVWMDYIKHTGLRLALQIVTILWLVRLRRLGDADLWRRSPVCLM